MSEKVSVIIRNKNEAKALDDVLRILNHLYTEDIAEIIVVDNLSTDESLGVAKKWNCNILTIKNFTYGRAINYGIANAASNYVLLLSSHAIPIGNNFFKNSVGALRVSDRLAGIRYINSFENYKRALENNFEVRQPLKFGLMAGCCMVNKKVWEVYKFDENLSFSEDKEWSQRVVKGGYKILDFNETFFYFIKRNYKSLMNRYKNETLAEYQLQEKHFPSTLRLIASSFKKIFLINSMEFFRKTKTEMELLKIRLEIRKKLQ